MKADKIREMLEAQREQNFRKRTESQIDGYARLSQLQKKRWESDEFRKKQSETISKIRKEKPQVYTEERRQKVSESINKRNADPEFKEKMKSVYAKRTAKGPSQKQLESAKQQGLNQRHKIQTPFGVYNGLLKTAESLGIAVGSLQQKMKDMPHLYYDVDKGPGETTFEKVWYTPYGETNHYNKRTIMRKAGVTSISLSFVKWFAQKADVDPDNWYMRLEPRREWGLRPNNIANGKKP